jgi:radical SAM superfamily enzyme YgiQ (UPF0313 family)
MKILLEIPSRALGVQPGYTKFPDEILMMASALEHAGHEVKIHDCNLDELQPADLKNFQPGIVGFSVATGPNIVDSLKRGAEYKQLLPDTKVVWGFRHPSALPEQTLKEEHIDFVVIGAGEETMVELATCLDGTADPGFESIKGLAYKTSSGKICINEARPFITKLDILPDPAWHLVDLKKYWDVSLIVSRGCPYNCTFCDDKMFHKGYIGDLSAERIVSQMERLKKDHGVNHILFSGENFALDSTRLRDFCQLVIHKKLKMTWNCRVSGPIEKEDIKLMAKSGCTSVILEIETGCQRVRQELLKKGSVKDMEDTFWELTRHKIMPTLFIMYGFPTETVEEFQMSLKMLKRLDYPPYMYMKYVPYPATELFDYCVDHKLFPRPQSLQEWVEFHMNFLADVNLSAVPQAMIDEALEEYRSTYGERRLMFTLKHNPRYFLKALKNPKQFLKDVRNLIRYSMFYRSKKKRTA